ncbi:MAG TPA: DUF5330 domain-containing protein [Xanthobacteraceae bacterium]|nr:DUF5330 domain-containing protein [Xanthobacteraceae bacterium]
MFFLLRLAFWLALVLVLLPGMPTSDKAAGDAVGALGAIGAAVADAGGFCERRPQACAVGGQLLDAASERMGEGARMVAQFLGTHIAEQKRQANTPASHRPANDTLTTDDLSPAWRGPTDAVAPHGTTVPLPPKRPA